MTIKVAIVGVGKTLKEAIFTKPNCTPVYYPKVEMGKKVPG